VKSAAGYARNVPGVFRLEAIRLPQLGLT